MQKQELLEDHTGSLEGEQKQYYLPIRTRVSADQQPIKRLLKSENQKPETVHPLQEFRVDNVRRQLLWN